MNQAAKKSLLTPRRAPQQMRSIQRRGQIMQVTAELLERVGFDDLTTILIAREIGISVGTLYHYFPNKHSILHAIAEQWLVEYSTALDEILQWNLERISVTNFSDKSIDKLYDVYQSQRGILPLISAIDAVPELRELDQNHDQVVVGKLSEIMKRVGVEGNYRELARLAFNFLEMTHALLVVALDQSASARRATLNDIKRLSKTLLNRKA